MRIPDTRSIDSLNCRYGLSLTRYEKLQTVAYKIAAVFKS